jgi:hypothetical protein
MNILQAISGLIPSIGETITKFVKDKDLAAQLEHDITSKLVGFQSEVVQAKAAIIVAEAQGQSYIQRNWRPITMLTFVFIIANNYILVPYAVAFGAEVPMLDIPPGMWSLLTVGIGGYIGGRTYEKVTAAKGKV